MLSLRLFWLDSNPSTRLARPTTAMTKISSDPASFLNRGGQFHVLGEAQGSHTRCPARLKERTATHSGCTTAGCTSLRRSGPTPGPRSLGGGPRRKRRTWCGKFPRPCTPVPRISAQSTRRRDRSQTVCLDSTFDQKMHYHPRLAGANRSPITPVHNARTQTCKRIFVSHAVLAKKGACCICLFVAVVR